MTRLSKCGVSLSATVVVVVLVIVCAAWLAAALGAGFIGSDNWLIACLRSRLTILAGTVALASAAAAYLLCGTLLRLGRSGRRENGQAGTAAIEFVLVLPVALMVVLILMQSVMLATGNINVHYAAYAAARSAIVWAPEKLSGEEPRNVVADSASSAKMSHITAAAVYALMPVSAGHRVGGETGAAGDAATVQAGIERFYQLYGVATPGWVGNILAAKYEYAAGHTEVTLDKPANSFAYGETEDLRVHVKHTLYLSVPYANLIFGRKLSGSSGDYGVDVSATCALGNQGLEDEIDVEQFPRTVGRGG